MVERGFRLKAASSNVANVQDVDLSDPTDLDSKDTRRILRPRIVPNIHNSAASVQATIIHQRRHKRAESWQDVDSFSLSRLHGGEMARLELSAGQTRRLYEALAKLYQIAPGGWTKGSEQNVLVIEGSNAGDLTELLPIVLDAFKRGGKRLFKQIVEAEPDLVRTAAIMERHQERTAVVRDFEKALRENVWDEGKWEEFFVGNTWIFGLNLAFQFLGTITTQPKYVAPSVFGGGGQRGDFLMTTTGDARFAVVVDIKKPDALLVRDRPYREHVHAPALELSSGVAQVQAYCSAIELKAQTDRDESIEFDKRQISPLQPKGVLIIGHTASLDDRYKRDSFARFRHNTLTPEVITYDELLARARFIVDSEAEELPDDDWDEDFGEVPFD